MDILENYTNLSSDNFDIDDSNYRNLSTSLNDANLPSGHADTGRTNCHSHNCSTSLNYAKLSSRNPDLGLVNCHSHNCSTSLNYANLPSRDPDLELVNCHSHNCSTSLNYANLPWGNPDPVITRCQCHNHSTSLNYANQPRGNICPQNTNYHNYAACLDANRPPGNCDRQNTNHQNCSCSSLTCTGLPSGDPGNAQAHNPSTFSNYANLPSDDLAPGNSHYHNVSLALNSFSCLAIGHRGSTVFSFDSEQHQRRITSARIRRRKEPKPLQEREDFLESMQQLQLKEWYWGPLSYEQAASVLRAHEDGSFLVRDSSDRKYLLSLSFKSLGEVYHTRIEHAKGLFSFWSQPDSHGKARICEFIEKSVQNSHDGKFLYFLRPMDLGSPPLPIRLLNPVSRNFRIPSLRHLSRFVIRQAVRRDHIEFLPVPQKVKTYLRQKQFYVEFRGAESWNFEFNFKTS